MRNKKVLTLVLKVLKHVSCLISRGSELKSLGAATACHVLVFVYLFIILYIALLFFFRFQEQARKDIASITQRVQRILVDLGKVCCSGSDY